MHIGVKLYTLRGRKTSSDKLFLLVGHCYRLAAVGLRYPIFRLDYIGACKGPEVEVRCFTT